jgi:hypothetical protein
VHSKNQFCLKGTDGVIDGPDSRKAKLMGSLRRNLHLKGEFIKSQSVPDEEGTEIEKRVPVC